MKKTIWILILLLSNSYVRSQNANSISPAIENGSQCPNITLTGIQDYKVNKATINDFRGKWLVLDFWERGCESCFTSFPRINDHVKKYSNNVQYFLIGREDKNKDIYKIYEKYKKELNLKIPHLYDTSLFKIFDIGGCPTSVIIAPHGIIYAYTGVLSDENINDLIQGKKPSLVRGYRAHEKRDSIYDYKDLNEKTAELVFKSELFKWNPKFYAGSTTRIYLDSNNHRYQTGAESFPELYMLAYFGRVITPDDSAFGKIYSRPVLEVTNDAPFIGNSQKEDSSNLYIYKLKYPDNIKDVKAIMHVMQNDLKNYLGYDVSLEERDVPCWILTATDEARKKLPSTSPHYLNGNMDTGFVAKKFPIKDLIKGIWWTLPDRTVPIINETGIKGNIDIEIKHLIINQKEMNKGLVENGLILTKGIKKMTALVIRDPEKEKGRSVTANGPNIRRQSK